MSKRRNRSRLRRISLIMKKVNRRAAAAADLSDAQLREKTTEFKNRLQNGETLDALLPEAYAVVREAAKRVLGMYPYDTQVMGAIVLHEGKIAEMKTGEGKTLVASMPLYLNALTGRSCMLVTTNNYLAVRDGTQLGELFRFLSITLEIGVNEDPQKELTTEDKKRIYRADIVYTTNSALGFDYLLENLAISEKEQYFRDFYYVIIDEADSVLLDAAQTPLVISGVPRVQSNLYNIADYFVSLLQEGEDYILEEKDAWLTENGIRKAERFFYLDDLYGEGNFEFVRHICLALRAHTAFEKDRQYVVERGQVILLDERTGRLLESTKLRAGQHQALEAREHVNITQESHSMASVTYQNFFNMFEKKAGMSGTAQGEEEELEEIYQLEVVAIPTNKKVCRRDYPDRVYPNVQASVAAAVEEIVRVHETGQPLLVIASSISMSDTISGFLLQKGIPHNVLNAYNTAKEAEIIKEAGQKNAVTVATSVAGRGTDIRLGEGVEELGGLAVIGIGRMENQRQELQARGRAGRQGDPGYSRFYVSLEDEVVDRYGAEWLEKHREGSGELHSQRFRHAIHRAQRLSEERGEGARRATMEFGESMRRQREQIYVERQKLLEENGSAEHSMEKLLQMGTMVIDEYLEECEKNGSLPGRAQILRYVTDHLRYELNYSPEESDLNTRTKIRDYLLKMTKDCLAAKLHSVPENLSGKYLRIMMLRAVDDAWVEEVDYLQQLRTGILGRQYTQRNISYAYHEEAFQAYCRMWRKIRSDMIRNVCLGELVYHRNGKIEVMMP